MQIHQVKPRTKRKRMAQVGRGGKRGKTSGRGTKGQKARSGHKIRPEIRDFIKKLPKLRGRGRSSFKSFTKKDVGVNLGQLGVFKSGDRVTPVTLLAKGVLKGFNSYVPTVKILGTGDIATKLIFVNCSISSAARTKIEAAGGTIK